MRAIIVPSDPPPQVDQTTAKSSTSKSSTDTPTKTLQNPSSSLKSPGGTRVYFLSCSHCKWSTRDVGIDDKRSILDFKERTGPYQGRVNELVAFYKEYAIQDEAEREKAKKPRRTRFGGLLDPTKFKSSLANGGESPVGKRRGSSLTWDNKQYEKMKAVAVEPGLAPEKLYSTSINLSEIPTMNQRCLDPVFQPSSSLEFWPHQLFLSAKTLHRCFGCDHILIKSEMNPGSIRFKIQQIAWHVFPHIRIMKIPSFEAGKQSIVLLSVINPISDSVVVSFHQFSPNVARVKEVITPCSLPEGSFVLTPSDDLGDLLDDENEVKDDPQFVDTRLPGKLVLKFCVTPENIAESIRLMFEMEFSYKPMIESDQNSSESTVKIPVMVRL